MNEIPRKHRCLRCRREFVCQSPDICQAGYDAMPTVIVESGRTFDSYEHCPLEPGGHHG